MQPTGTEPSGAAPAKNMDLGHFFISVTGSPWHEQRIASWSWDTSFCYLLQEKCGPKTGQQTEGPRVKRVYALLYHIEGFVGEGRTMQERTEIGPNFSKISS